MSTPALTITARTWDEVARVIDLATRAHDTASATARHTASLHAKERRQMRDDRGRWAKDPGAQSPLDMAEKKRLADMWANSYRYSGRYMSSDDKQRGQDFAGELHRLLSANTPPESSSAPGVQDVHKFLAMVDQDATVHDAVLSRGVGLDPADAERMFQPGAVVDMPVAAWTADQSQAREFARMSSKKPGYTKVILHTAPGAMGMDLAPVSSGSISMDEQEVVTGGRYSVDSVQTANGVINVYVTQQAFSAH